MRFERWIFLLLILLLVSSGVAIGQRKAGEVTITPRTFESAGGEKVDVEFGQLYVPENRRKPNGPFIELAFVRFKSTSKKPGSPIVYLAGGPGGSGISAARGTRFPLFIAMREVADVIALDQRGTGLSKPNLQCRESLDYPADKPASRAELVELFKTKSRACAESFRQQGVDLTGYNTNESADDLEDLRKAIGAPKISLWGISYGTHLGLAAIKRHEQSIDRMILAGVEGLQHTAKLPSNIQRHLENLDRMVKADPVLSKEIPSLLSLMKDVLDRLDRNPVVVEVTDPNTKQNLKVTINKFVVQILTAFAFGSGEAQIPAIYHALSSGDYSYPAVRWIAFNRSGQSIGNAMAFMMDCYSGTPSARRAQIAREAKTTLLADVIDFPFPDVCEAFGNPDLGDRFREPAKSNIPALFISGTLDVRTPPSNAEEVRRGFKNSEHLMIEGAVHSDPLFLSSPKIKEVMLEFMKGEKPSTTSIVLERLKFQSIVNTHQN